ncbi:MAG: DEAD/DEAH box helicase [Allisonella histaminiformans]|uniref:ATP-dependent RNA helicase DeaD n=1 Tax=Allisonella histaminiformans TaxID=209880 RepID=A0A1G5UUK8_9FIRM|nr:DEAD/DEAH box helicase [Allisonella histaminiformans]PWL46904.1 MAG: ATP-dependent helicase [Veillonellaceae bacterium]MCI6002891.1 DEAD/DEAH box helicase [Allisonella histaminiformans]MDD6870832.1 DEAD/DEAH box helicase [Allisonella histaminiformans]MDY3957303.1 DEAD/DEAH box helicase [Allisonella histaminiformans]MDY4540801.1 DEAD/DEAH box helicase [Allisonella histaminiformans]
MTSFAALGVIPALTEVLNKQGIKVATPVQEKAIPAIFKGRDVIAKSQTGTGKTLAYLLPLVQRIQTERDEVQALILTPTRELSKQVFDVLKSLASVRGVDAADVIGGRTIENQIQKLKRNPHVIIGTPGRLLDHIRRRTLNLSAVKMVILDEADQMLAAGFREDIEALVDQTPKKRQFILLSATMTEDTVRLARKYMTNPERIDVAEKETASTVEQRIYETTKEHKLPLLIRHLKEMNPFMSVVFCNTKDEAHRLAERLAEETDIVVEELHGDMSQGQRNQVIRRFEKMEIQVLVASDVAARGLDVEGITHVFNFGIPRNLEYYVHRIGRTGRAGTHGIAITYVTPEDGALLRRLEKSIHETITRYDEKGRIRRVRQARPKKKVVVPGMYKPTKKKEHKALGHRGRDMRKRVKKDKTQPQGRRGRRG